jgi:hypothetical protein
MKAELTAESVFDDFLLLDKGQRQKFESMTYALKRANEKPEDVPAAKTRKPRTQAAGASQPSEQ